MRSWTPLHAAALIGDAAGVATLLAAGADPSPRDEHGETPLHLAAHIGDAAIVSALLAAGADHAATFHGGMTPLHAAARSDYIGSLGPSVAANAARSAGLPWLPHQAQAFQAAWDRRDPAATCAALLAAGADADATNSTGQAPRSMAQARARPAFAAHDLSVALPRVQDWRAARAGLAEPPSETTHRPRL